jgi:hypothetical protein
LRLEWSSLRRCINLCIRLKTVHHRLTKGPHLYFVVLGLKSWKLEGARASALLRPLLSRADSDETSVSVFRPGGLLVH